MKLYNGYGKIKYKYIFLLFIFLSLLFSVPVSATEFKSGGTVVIPSSQIIDDDLVTAGGNVDIDGTINGDLIVAGGNVKIAGYVNGSVIATGGVLEVTGRVANDIVAMGGTIEINNSVLDNALLAGGTVILGRAGSIGKDLYVGAGIINIAGYVNGNASLNSEHLIVQPSAKIQGNLEYTSEKIITIPEGVVEGTTRHILPKPKTEGLYKLGIFLKVIGFFAIVLIGILLTKLAPRNMMQIADTMRKSFWKCMGIGVVCLIVIPIISLILMITLIGFPLGLIILALYIIAIYLAKIFVGLLLGQTILEKIKKPSTSLIHPLVIGILLLTLLASIPYIGFLIILAYVILGLGALFILVKIT
ncbi:MAG TPA: hypothetical protein EYP22_07615 [Methanosarcinales archaeon]|nr:hypothetical protein [Methanosarcinales archaeon]